MYKYSLQIIPEAAEMPKFTMSTTMIRKRSIWLTTTEILQELETRHIQMSRPRLLRKGQAGEIEMRLLNGNKKTVLFNLTEVLEKFA